MNQALIFVRTKLDADNLEDFFNRVSGGGKKGEFTEYRRGNDLSHHSKEGLSSWSIHAAYYMEIVLHRKDDKIYKCLRMEKFGS